MSVEIVVPTLGESVTEATVARWLKKPGERVERDDPLVELETDKVTLEVNATASGTLEQVKAGEGDTVAVGAVLGTIGEGAAGAAAPAPKKAAPKEAPSKEVPPKEAAPAAEPPAPAKPAEAPEPAAAPRAEGAVMPAARKLIDDHGLDATTIKGTGKDGRITKEDVQAVLSARDRSEDGTSSSGGSPGGTPAARAPETVALEVPAFERPVTQDRPHKDREERVRMSKLRRTIAARLKQAQNTAAMLTTFNEVDMSGVMAARAQLKDTFEKKHGVKLGFMSFFVKAAIIALKELPAVNAEIDGDEIVYKNYYDIGVAVSAPTGLVVPVLRDADRLSFAEIEKGIADLGRKARDGKLAMADLTGGTFTISNGGVFGSLLSTPILNPPQSAILGMHKIQERPVAVNGKVEIRPMMYLAVSYDHRIIDGREAVTFLVRLKECIEDPQRILLEV